MTQRSAVLLRFILMGALFGLVLGTFLVRGEMPLNRTQIIWQVAGAMIGGAVVTGFIGSRRIRRLPATARTPPLSAARRRALLILLTICILLLGAVGVMIARLM